MYQSLSNSSVHRDMVNNSTKSLSVIVTVNGTYGPGALVIGD
jgi:hypothetical protein